MNVRIFHCLAAAITAVILPGGIQDHLCAADRARDSVVEISIADEEDSIDETSWVTEADSTCVCEDVSCNGGCGGIASRMWIRAEYLQWWTKGNRLPALVTTSPPGTPQGDAGDLGVAGTRTLFGGDEIADQDRSGFRVDFGRWLDDCHLCGIEAIYFAGFNDGSTDDFFAQTTGGPASGNPILGRPFFDVNRNEENARLSSFPNLSDGSITVTSSSEFHSAEVLLRHHARSGPRGRIDFIGGYRYFRFREGLQIDENFVSTGLGGGVAVGTTIDSFDSFVTENDFHGGELGLAANFGRDCWNLEVVGKAALGNIHRTIDVNGSTTVTTPPPGSTTSTGVGGLLALTSNIAQTTENDIAILPELGVNLSYALNNGLRLRVGYTVLALNNVARTGDRIDRSINPNLFPGGTGAGVTAPLPQTDVVSQFWVQGVSFGLAGEF